MMNARPFGLLSRTGSFDDPVVRYVLFGKSFNVVCQADESLHAYVF